MLIRPRHRLAHVYASRLQLPHPALSAAAMHARDLRRHCNDCGSVELAWSTLGELTAVNDEAHELMGGMNPESPAWECLECGQFGAFDIPAH